MKRVALATCAEHPELPMSERGLFPALLKLGITGVPARWDNPHVDWTDYDAVIVRTTWDYCEKVRKFSGWFDLLESEHVPVFNPLPVLRWNLNKRYLAELESAGVKTVPTEWLTKAGGVKLGALLKAREWDQAVVKPVVSAGAFKTYRVSQDVNGGQNALETVLEHSDAMVQPFLPEIESEGEWSLIFIDGHFSHAVLKKAAIGDFRVQEEHGGSYAPVHAPAELVEQAQAIIGKVPGGPLLYARVDGVRRGKDFLLVELEVIEPELFLSWSPDAPARLAKAIAARLK